MENSIFFPAQPQGKRKRRAISDAGAAEAKRARGGLPAPAGKLHRAQFNRASSFPATKFEKDGL
jgi:hypothetical protein